MGQKSNPPSITQLEEQAQKAQTERQGRCFSNEEQDKNIKNLLYGSLDSVNTSDKT